MRTSWPRNLALLATLLFGAGMASVGRADLSEDQAKVSLIYNLTKFVQWPQTPPDRTLNLCVYRDDTITPTLASLRDKASKGLALRVQSADSTEESRNCQVLFIGRGEQANLRPLVRALRGSGILVISDIPDSARAGAMVEVFLDNKRIAFKINKAAADEANLKLSSQLLSLAKAIYDSY
jgi:hypothetical protein